MNLGVYLPILQEEIVGLVLKEVKKGLDSGKLTDASIFYDDAGPIPHTNVCGMFNSVDLWRFTGSLVTFSAASMARANAATNKFKTIYCHGIMQYELLDLLSTLKTKRCIAITKEAEADFVRVTGKRISRVCPAFNGLVEAVEGFKYE
jgi:hypothetical protein